MYISPSLSSILQISSQAPLIISQIHRPKQQKHERFFVHFGPFVELLLDVKVGLDGFESQGIATEVDALFVYLGHNRICAG